MVGVSNDLIKPCAKYGLFDWMKFAIPDGFRCMENVIRQQVGKLHDVPQRPFSVRGIPPGSRHGSTAVVRQTGCICVSERAKSP